MDILKNTKFDFIGKRYYAFIFSAILALVGIAAAVFIPLGKANLGIDFTGGVAMQLKFEKPFATENARMALDKAGFKDVELQQVAGGSQLLIRLKNAEGELKATADKLTGALAQNFADNNDNKFIVESTTAVGPTVGKKLQKDALWAVGISLLGILIYVAWRFELIFGIAAVIATFHDVLAVLGIFYIMNKEINLLIITALLTLAGYSLTDTVVVFDRIRENLRLIALLLAGGEVIHDFSLALFLGVMVGTYSSIFVASPLLLLWKGKRGRLIR
ncbi:MAG: protein translocase subunit SecF [Deltaproteobacteria bacterium]|nr:protein translocase subunit SecF [Deltaproteobacteria bacterium]